MDVRRLRYVIVGAGSIGRRHARNLRKLGAQRLLAVDTRPDRLASIESESAVPGVTDLDSAWGWGPDVVFVTLPTALHVSVALEAASRGCHLFVEKPLGSALDGVEELIAKSKALGLVTLVACNLRFHPSLTHAKALLIDGALGALHAARVAFGAYLPDWHPWEDYRDGYSARRASGGGVTLDAIHEIDYARWLFGPVDAVRAIIGRYSSLEIDTEDLAVLVLEHKNGMVTLLHLDYLARTPRRGCEIFAEDGTLRLDLISGELSLLGTAKSQTFKPSSDWQPNDMYVDELRHYFDCLTGNATPEQNVCSGADALRIALAAHESAHIGDRVLLRRPSTS